MSEKSHIVISKTGGNNGRKKSPYSVSQLKHIQKEKLSSLIKDKRKLNWRRSDTLQKQKQSDPTVIEKPAKVNLDHIKGGIKVAAPILGQKEKLSTSLNTQP